MSLDTPLQDLGFVYKAKKKPLEKLGLTTLKDLLYYPPAKYEQYPQPKPIHDVIINEEEVIEGKVAKMENQYTKRRFAIQKAIVWDETGEIECIWFNQTYLTKIIHEGDQIRAVGKIKPSGNKKTLAVKEYELITNGKTPIHITDIVPVYSETRGISSKWLRNRVLEQLNKNPEIEEIIPKEMREKHSLLPINQAIKSIHFPKNNEDINKAKFRLSYEELLIKHLASLRIKEEWNKKLKAHKFDVKKFNSNINALIKSLPFELTNAQKNAIDAIFSDLKQEKPMNRLLEGDVGSGKTIVAALAAYVAYLNNFQVAFMAPTSILAEQHYKTINDLLSPLGVHVSLFTSQSKSQNNKETRSKDNESKKPDTKLTANNSPFDIAVGTHALIHKKVDFNKLGFVVIDEQQRFGVEQRAILREKGDTPHVLTMTATPIPRTILVAAYGDLDLSILDEMPKDRKKIKTWLVPNEKRGKGYEWIKGKIDSGDQVFIVCPFIEPSESSTSVKAATEEYERLKNEIFKEYNLGLLHGKLKAEEKNKILTDFRDKKYDILVTTPVVEVGIDIPNATIMLIEGADRFGLAQLHQMRGRVGRGEKESYCLLFSDNLTPTTKKRLQSLEKIHAGPELAEIDLQIRGPGNIYGRQQHGRLEFKFASVFDKSLINLVKEDAKKLIDNIQNYPELRDELESTIIQKISPD